MKPSARAWCSAPVMPVMEKVSVGNACPARYSSTWKMIRWFSDQYQRSSTTPSGDGSVYQYLKSRIDCSMRSRSSGPSSSA